MTGAVAVPVGVTAAWLSAAGTKRFASEVAFTTEGSKRLVRSNGIPTHAIGDFPNWHDPVAVKDQNHQLSMPLK